MDQLRGRGRQQLLSGGLTLAFLLVAVSCQQSSGQDRPGTSAPPAAPTYVNTAYPRNHVPPNIYWGFAHVTFTAQTTYDLADTILSQVGVHAYPMVNPPCGDLREAGAPISVATAMSPEEVQADFQRSHSMLVQTDAWEKLDRVAALPGVVAVNPFPLPKSCPAHAPI